MANISNQATLSYNGQNINSNIATGQVREVLSATKKALFTGYRPQDYVTFVITLTNSSSEPFEGLVITDYLGEFVEPVSGKTVYTLDFVPNTINYYENGVQQNSVSNAYDNILTISDIEVPQNGNATIIYQVQINEFAPLNKDGTIIDNTIISGGNLTVDIPLNVELSTIDEPNLVLSKTIHPLEVFDNEEITYIFVIQNFGNVEAPAANVYISDKFDPAIEITRVYFGTTEAVINTDYTYDVLTKTFATVPGRFSVPAAEFTRNPVDGSVIVTPGSVVIRVTGII